MRRRNYNVSYVGASNVTLVKNCVSQQKCVNSAGSVIGTTKTSSTEIGGEMEIDQRAATDSAFMNRYNTYVSNFSTFITGSTKRPIAYYADRPEQMMIETIFGRMKNFLNNGT